MKREVSRSDVDPPEFDAVEPNNCPVIDDQHQPQLGNQLQVRHVEGMAQVNAEVTSAVAGWKRRDDPAYFGDGTITDRCRTQRPVRVIKGNPSPGVGRNGGFACSKNVSPGGAGGNE